MASLSRDERLSEMETIIRWDGHKDTVSIWTASKAVLGKLKRAGYSPKRGGFAVPYSDLRWSVKPDRKRRKNPLAGDKLRQSGGAS